MKRLAHKLKNRIQILREEQEPGKFGFDKVYTRLIRLWADIELRSVTGTTYVQAVFRQNIGAVATHDFIVRWASVTSKYSSTFAAGFDENFPGPASQGMGREFNIAFSTDFDAIIDLNPVKADQFVLVEGVNTYQGRLFQIVEVLRDEEYKEFVRLKCIEVEEQGTGAKFR